MKRILIVLLTILTVEVMSAQNDIASICQKAIAAANDNDFLTAKHNYDAAISIISGQPNSDKVLNITEELSEYIIVNQAKINPEEAHKYALDLLELQMHCLNYCTSQGIFKTREDYADNLSMAMIGMGYKLAEAGLLKDAEDCIGAGINIYTQYEIYTVDYIMGYGRLAYFYSNYCKDYVSELNSLYEGFKAAVSLTGADSVLSSQFLGMLCTSYATDLAFLADMGEYAENWIPKYGLTLLSYEQVSDITELWGIYKNEIISTYGTDTYQALLNANPINLNGDSRIRFGTEEWSVFYKLLAAIYYRKVDDYERYCSALFDMIHDPDDIMAYSRDIITALRNRDYINLAFELYDALAVKVISRKDLVESVESLAGSFAFKYGFYDKAWSYVSDLTDKQNSCQYVNKEAYLNKMSLLSSLYGIKNDNASRVTVLCNAVGQADSDSLSIPQMLRSILYNNLSVAYRAVNENAKALESIERAISIRCTNAIENGEDPDDVESPLWPVTEYGNLADIYLDNGEFEKARQIYNDCLSHYKYNNPLQSYDMKHYYYSLMYISEACGDYEMMRELADTSYSQTLESYLTQSFGMTKLQRTDFWYKTESQSFEIFSHLALKYDLFTEIAYNAALVQKGFLLKYDRIISKNVAECNDLSLIQAFNDYKAAESSGSSEKYLLEEKLMYMYSKHPEFIRNMTFPTWKDVQRGLSKGDLAIEFARCCSDGKNVSYAAIMVRTGWEKPIVVELSTEKEMADLFAKGARIYLDNDRFYSMIWGKIEPYMTGVKRIFFSPDGLLTQMNIEVLCSKKGRPINQVYDIYRVTSTSDLGFIDGRCSYSSATLFGGLNYDLDTASMEEISRGYACSAYCSNYTIDYKSDMTRKGWSYLSGTKREVEQISAILDNVDIMHMTISSDSGTEEALKSFSGKSPQILHIATHGFYLNEKQAERLHPGFLDKNENDSHIYPLRRCGLIMAGGQHAWLGESVPDGIDDGILLAEEIAGLNLFGTDLLVLSACQTGLGEIAGDGVYGLQRGFKIAGVNTIIMSLWEVDDQATALMMQTFYRHLVKGKSKREAFTAAQNEVKKKHSDPRYWASFIILD